MLASLSDRQLGKLSWVERLPFPHDPAQRKTNRAAEAEKLEGRARTIRAKQTPKNTPD